MGRERASSKFFQKGAAGPGKLDIWGKTGTAGLVRCFWCRIGKVTEPWRQRRVRCHGKHRQITLERQRQTLRFLNPQVSLVPGICSLRQLEVGLKLAKSFIVVLAGSEDRRAIAGG